MRNVPIDIARGLAIMVVIFWHIVGIHSPWTDGWVMPVFFVIMGIFYRHVPSFKMLLKKKSRTILVPHLIGSIPAFAVLLCNTGYYNTIKAVLNPYSCINPVSWFLVCMFFCYLVYWGINQIAGDKTYVRIILSFAISILGFYTSQINFLGVRLVLPFFISTSFTVMAFIEIGHLLNPYLFPKRSNIEAFDKAVGGGKIYKQNYNHNIVDHVYISCAFTPSVFREYEVE